MRIGQGYDVHRLTEGRKCILGGVDVPFSLGLDGHSDADVLTHAVIDALLGAAGQGDIGKRYPDSEDRWKDADSLILLKDTVSYLRMLGFSVVNVDSTVICQRPRIGPYREQMQRNLADAMGIHPSCVNVKGKTEEGLGFTGAGLGIAAQAIALLEEHQ